MKLWSQAFGLLALALGLCTATYSEVPVGWQSLHFEGRKLLRKIKVQVSVVCQPESVAAEQLTPLLLEQALMPEGQIVVIGLDVGAGSQKQAKKSWLDAGRSYSILQQDKIEWGKSPTYRLDRYKIDGFRRKRRKAGPDERSLPPSAWPVSGEQERLFPQSLLKQSITTADALPYLLAASAIRKPGHQSVFYVMQDGYGFRIRLSAQAFKNAKLKFQLTHGNQSEKINQRKQLLAVQLTAEPLEAASKSNFTWLGLNRNIRFLLDLDNRAVVSLSGQSQLGRIVLKLKALKKAKDNDCFTQTKRPVYE